MVVLKLPLSLKGTKIIAQGKADRPQPWVQDKDALATLEGSNDHYQILLPFRERKNVDLYPGVTLVPRFTPGYYIGRLQRPFVFNS